MPVLIFANGDMPSYEWAMPILDEATVIIAANGGTRHILALNRRPDIVVGDLDSFPPSQRDALRSGGTQFAEHPAAKDETDLELALLFAARHYDEDIVVLAGLGGRVDQMFANILLLMHPTLRQKRIRFRTEFQEIWLMHDRTEIRGEVGDIVSLIPLGGDVLVQATSGLRWALHDDVLAYGPARGLSNVMTEAIATVSIETGHLLCVHTKKTWER